MNKKRILGASIFIILAILVIVTLKFRSDIKHPFTVNKQNVEFTVKEGDSLFQVIDKLNQDGLMKNKILMKLYIKNSKLKTFIKPGKYYISSDASIEEIVSILNKGMNVNVTIPEGYDIEKIAALLEKKELTSKEEFIKACKNYKLPSYIKNNSKVKYALEGYLFPDTYEFKKDSSSNEIISIMLNRFEEVLNEIKKEGTKEIDNLSQKITIASIIEKEARIDEDRRKISSVIYNRLQKNMRLQIDATVLYALGEHKSRLYLKDLKIESPYNTYKVSGITPGPICSPGKESIKAALNPENTGYIYYVLEDNKKHYFTNSYQEFLKAKERYKSKTN